MGYRTDEEREQDRKDQKRLEKMSVEELRVELNTRMKESLLAEIEKLPERIDAHMDSAAWSIICAALGVKKDSWHDSKWEIDTHHEKAALSIALGKHALAAAEMAIPDFIKGLVVGDPRIPPIKTAYTKAYKEKLAELVNHKLWEVAHKNAEKRFVEIMEMVGSTAKIDKSMLKEPWDEEGEEDEEGDEEVSEATPEAAEQEKEET